MALIGAPQTTLAVGVAAADGGAPGQPAAALPALIEAGLLAGAYDVDETVQIFYRQRGFQPVWNRPERIHELIAAVEALRDHGLDPSEFEADGLRAEASLSVAALPPERQVERELRLTGTLARLVQQIRFGRVDPRGLYRMWNFSVPEQALSAPCGSRASLMDRRCRRPWKPRRPICRSIANCAQRCSSIARWRPWATGQRCLAAQPCGRASAARVPAVRARLAAEGEGADGLVGSDDPARYDDALAQAVMRFQRRAGLAPDAAIGRQTVDALNIGPAQRVDQIRVSLERLRWVAQDMQGDHLLADITAYHAHLRLGGLPAWSSRVIVGKSARATPALLDSVQHLVFNPKWVVPPTILREDVIPGVVRNPEYLADHRMRVVDRSGQAVDPALIDWQNARRSGFPYMIVQASGADGSLGRIKFSLANPYSIYLHDTNARSLFRRDMRALSSGCVRLEKPQELALILLDDAARWTPEALEAALAGGKTRSVPVAREIPVLLHYATAGLDEEGRFQFRPDIYDRDAAVLAALNAAPR
ncbi:L,D-transpeptidase family protein [Thauera humireducens]|uniref:L,D-transpeptidase family protein n=1 Tax=Thauera humireducens TaxID=1134435 RepID=UPI00311E0F98